MVSSGAHVMSFALVPPLVAELHCCRQSFDGRRQMEKSAATLGLAAESYLPRQGRGRPTVELDYGIREQGSQKGVVRQHLLDHSAALRSLCQSPATEELFVGEVAPGVEAHRLDNIDEWPAPEYRRHQSPASGAQDVAGKDRRRSLTSQITVIRHISSHWFSSKVVLVEVGISQI
jgi:hypothetical protein